MLTKFFKRLSYLDYVIIALLLCFCISLLSRYARAEKRREQSELLEATVSFEIQKSSRDILSALSTDSKLLFTTGERLGSILPATLEASPAVNYTFDLDGAPIKAYSVSLYDIRGALSVSGFVGEGGFLANGNAYIAPNMTLKVKNSLAELDILILNVEIP